MIRAKNCEKLPKFVKVTATIRSVPFLDMVWLQYDLVVLTR